MCGRRAAGSRLRSKRRDEQWRDVSKRGRLGATLGAVSSANEIRNRLPDFGDNLVRNGFARTYTVTAQQGKQRNHHGQIHRGDDRATVLAELLDLLHRKMRLAELLQYASFFIRRVPPGSVRIELGG
ncbi:MAG: hypothetical protein ACI915_001283 [Gammaproteobacteria bacterium]|jgi:hypothetical protein